MNPNPQDPSAPKVIALCGSLRAGSHTRKALDLAIEGAKKGGAEVTLVELSGLKLPPFDDGPSKEDPEVVRWKELVKAADGLLIGTPVYHDSYGGMLKNALDFLYLELADKVAGLIAVGGGRVGQGQALEHLRAVLREPNTWVLPRQVVIPSSKEAFDENGALKDKETVTRLGMLGMELVARCKQLRPKKRAP
ncbi:MAG TPA: NAD(P)H-dependent oxidoreductase [Myxococcaceae bacterium]|nr:NAD(P)H-dependent oxidoreductase [Myxococcaceae bacterium]